MAFNTQAINYPEKREISICYRIKPLNTNYTNSKHPNQRTEIRRGNFAHVCFFFSLLLLVLLFVAFNFVVCLFVLYFLVFDHSDTRKLWLFCELAKVVRVPLKMAKTAPENKFRFFTHKKWKKFFFRSRFGHFDETYTFVFHVESIKRREHSSVVTVNHLRLFFSFHISVCAECGSMIYLLWKVDRKRAKC